MSRARTAAMAVVLALGVPATAGAATCTIEGTVGVAFGTYDVFEGAPVDSVGSIDYSCTGVGVSDMITIELGTGGGGSFAPRHLLDGPDTLAYNLFLDASLLVVFGDGTAGTSRIGPSKPPEDDAITVSVYGRIPPRQDARVGSYTDTVMVTITF
jgi:spore coat protein U-like protein